MSLLHTCHSYMHSIPCTIPHILSFLPWAYSPSLLYSPSFALHMVTLLLMYIYISSTVRHFWEISCEISSVHIYVYHTELFTLLLLFLSRSTSFIGIMAHHSLNHIRWKFAELGDCFSCGSLAVVAGDRRASKGFIGFREFSRLLFRRHTNPSPEALSHEAESDRLKARNFRTYAGAREFLKVGINFRDNCSDAILLPSYTPTPLQSCWNACRISSSLWEIPDLWNGHPDGIYIIIWVLWNNTQFHMVGYFRYRLSQIGTIVEPSLNAFFDVAGCY